MDKIIVLSSDDEENYTYSTPAMRGKPVSFKNKNAAKTGSAIGGFEFDCGAALDYVGLSPELEEVPSTSSLGSRDISGKDFDYTPSLEYVKLSPELDLVRSSPSLTLSRSGQKLSRRVHDLSDSDDADEGIASIHQQKKLQSSDDELPDLNIPQGPSRGASNKNTKFESKMFKNQKREEQRQQKQFELAEKAKQRSDKQQEKERKKREAAHAKALKQASAEIKRAQKPGECMKWVSAILDPGLLSVEYSGELLTTLQESEIDYKVEESIVPCSIAWERRLQNILVDEDRTVQKTTTIQREKFVLVVWIWNKLIEHIHDNLLEGVIEEMVSLLPSFEITLVIFGLEDYFRFQKTQKRRDIRSEVLGSGPQKRKGKEGTFEAAPAVSRGDVESALAELQVVSNISHRCINSRKDLANLVCQFSKAIAEAPFKREEKQKHAKRLDWYALGDSMDCVSVDKDGIGSLQLWRRQLCQFPLASLETSEAIASVYPSPVSLILAYEGCSNEEQAQSLLQDISVRRGPGPLSTTRRIGPQLSRKIHSFFTTCDETSLIAPD